MVSSEWFSEGGPDSPPLSPPNQGTVKTLPLRHVSVVDGALPSDSTEIRTVNLSYLEVAGAITENKWGMVFLALAAVPASPLTIAATVFVALSDPVMWGLIAFMVVCCVILNGMAATCFCLAVYSPADEPIRFDRKSGKLYRYRIRQWRFVGVNAPVPWGGIEILTHNWSDVRAEVVRKVLFNGKTARMDCFLEFAIIDPKTQLVTERFRVGDRDVFSDFTGRVVLWEAIRRYMEDGPERVPAPRCEVSDNGFIDSIEAFNPVSAPFLFPPGTARFLGGIMGALLWLVTPLNVLFALCNWIGAKTAKPVDWGELDQTIFKISPTDEWARAQAQRQQALYASPEWTSEQRRRRWSAAIWLVLIVVWYLGAAWLFDFPPFVDWDYF